MSADLIPLLGLTEFLNEFDTLALFRFHFATKQLHSTIKNLKDEWRKLCIEDLGSEEVLMNVFLPAMQEMRKCEAEWYEVGRWVACTKAVFGNSLHFSHTEWTSSIRYVHRLVVNKLESVSLTKLYLSWFNQSTSDPSPLVLPNANLTIAYNIPIQPHHAILIHVRDTFLVDLDARNALHKMKLETYRYVCQHLHFLTRQRDNCGDTESTNFSGCYFVVPDSYMKPSHYSESLLTEIMDRKAKGPPAESQNKKSLTMKMPIKMTMTMYLVDYSDF